MALLIKRQSADRVDDQHFAREKLTIYLFYFLSFGGTVYAPFDVLFRVPRVLLL